MHVQHANDVIKILKDHNIDTTCMQVTLDSFSGKRAELQTALKNRDNEALKTINTELRELAKQFFKEMRDAIREHYGATGTADTARTGGIAGMTGAGSGLAVV
jgi:DNA gyrase/topoisomerase IV subunit A